MACPWMISEREGGRKGEREKGRGGGRGGERKEREEREGETHALGNLLVEQRKEKEGPGTMNEVGEAANRRREDN